MTDPFKGISDSVDLRISYQGLIDSRPTWNVALWDKGKPSSDVNLTVWLENNRWRVVSLEKDWWANTPKEGYDTIREAILEIVGFVLTVTGYDSVDEIRR